MLSIENCDPVLTQSTAVQDGHRITTVVLDFWADPQTGTLTDRSDVSLAYDIAEGATIKDASGRALRAENLAAITDYSEPVALTATLSDGSTVDYEIRVEVLVTPVRISGDRGAQQPRVGATDPTGATGWRFFADPQVVAEGGKYYIFPTTDGHSGWAGYQIHAFESEGLVTWEDKGVVVDLKDQKLDGSEDTSILPERTSKAWAPAFAARNGRFYLYFSGNGQVNVAISDPANGGTIDSGYELQPLKVESSIDPAAFQDPQTGTWYLAWGNSHAYIAELNDDMTSVDESTKRDVVSSLPGFREGSYLHARQYRGEWTYYFTYSIDDANSPEYRVGYATATSMDGPWTYRGEILSKDAALGILGTAHHAVLQVPGTDDWYVVYHAFLTDEMRPRGIDQSSGQQIAMGNKRETRIARLTYTEPTAEQVAAGEVPLLNRVPVTYEGVLPETTPSVTISGAAGQGATAVGATLAASFNDGWTGTSWQWYRGGEPIAGATEASYRLTDEDAEATITVRGIGESTTGVTNNASTDVSATDEITAVEDVRVGPESSIPPASARNAGPSEPPRGCRATPR